jgi:hypothetical protein
MAGQAVAEGSRTWLRHLSRGRKYRSWRAPARAALSDLGPTDQLAVQMVESGSICADMRQPKHSTVARRQFVARCSAIWQHPTVRAAVSFIRMDGDVRLADHQHGE